MNKEFYSEYCTVKYIDENNIVLLTWKKFASFENYREPTTFALEMMKEHPNSNFIIDARNGFEDEKEDVEWGFSYLLPEISKTDCRKVAFVMNQVNEIEDEMDMWTKEFGKYFAVYKAVNYEEAIYKMEHMIWVDVAYVIKDGKKEEFYSKLIEQNIINDSRKEPGNYRYDFSVSVEKNNELWLTEIWTDAVSQKYHGTTEHYKKLTVLKQEYVERVIICKYSIMEF